MSLAASSGNGRWGPVCARRFGWLLAPGLALLGALSCGRTNLTAGDAYQGPTATAGAKSTGSAGRASGGQASAHAGNTSAGSDGGAVGTTTAGSSNSGGDSAGGSSGASATLRLRGAPLVFASTASELGLSVALVSGNPSALRARARAEGEAWQSLLPPQVRAPDLAEWRLPVQKAGTSYEYQIADATSEQAPTTLFSGHAVTQRSAGASFGFALISDTHIGADPSYFNQGDPSVLQAVSTEIGASSPDFVINLGDILDFHQYGFNDPPPDASIPRLAYLNYREAWGNALANLNHFGTIGNWDGENGSFSDEEISRSRSQRRLYLPTPGPTTYREGAGPEHDYYAFTWGDALFVVLNVMSYTKSALLLSTSSGHPDDWTLGKEQLAWLERTLQGGSSKWRFLFIHHTVGGAAGDEADSIYGRGGGQAAHVGEQAKVHQLMLDYGVQVFFYGHDHVFTDMVVEGVHYSTPSNAGAIWTFPGSQTGYTRYWDQSGWARVDVTPNDVHVQFLAVGGQQLLDYTLVGN